MNQILRYCVSFPLYNIPYCIMYELTSTDQSDLNTKLHDSDLIYIFQASPVFSLLNDTTSQHDSHMFDQNCSICTSKNKPTATTPTTTSEDKEDNSEDRSAIIYLTISTISPIVYQTHKGMEM